MKTPQRSTPHRRAGFGHPVAGYPTSGHAPGGHASGGHPGRATAPDWLAALEGGVVRSYAPGETIASPEALTDRLFVVQTGLVRLSLTEAGKELTLGFLRPGGIYVTHTRAWVTAVETAQLTSWPVGEMLALVTRAPALGVAAFAEVGQLLRGALDLLEDLAFRPVSARLARFILAETAAQGGAVIVLPDSTERLATALGTSRQTLSTLLNGLIRDGILARPDRRHLRLIDRDRLARLGEVSGG